MIDLTTASSEEVETLYNALRDQKYRLMAVGFNAKASIQSAYDQVANEYAKRAGWCRHTCNCHKGVPLEEQLAAEDNTIP